MVRVEAVLDSWKAVRKHAAQAVLDMPEGSLDFQPTPDLMKFRDIALHVLNAGRAFAGLLADGATDFTAPDFRQRMASYFLAVPGDVTPASLAALMNETVEADAASLGAMPAEFWGVMMKRFDGLEVTRLEMLQFCKEHELTHRSQMFMYLRLQGVIPSTTRAKMAKK